MTPGGAAAPGVPRPPDAGRSEPADASEKGAETDADAAAATSKKVKTAGPVVVPAGSAGVASAPEGILLRYNPDAREWERLTAQTPLAAGARLLCLYPSKATVTIGKTQVVMVGECEIRILPQSTEAAPAIELAQGWLLFHPDSPGTLKVGLGDRLITLEVPSGGGAALERSARWLYGRLVSPVPPLLVHGTTGDVAVTAANKQETLAPLEVLTIDRTGAKHSTEEALPLWANEGWPSPGEIAARDQFAKIFHPGRPVLAEIVSALEEKNAETKQLAVAGLKSMGELSYLMPLLFSRKDDPAVRRGALAAIRSYTALGPEASGKVREQIVEEVGEETASMAGKMIVGFTPQEAASPQLFSQLVALLGPEEESVGVRELAARHAQAADRARRQPGLRSRPS